MKPIIVFGCDNNFVNYTQSALASIAAHPSLNSIPVGLLDCGISEENLEYFRTQNLIIRKAEWTIPFPQLDEWKENLPSYKAIMSRPFLPDYFTEFDVIIWLDSDLWVQTPVAIHDFLAAASWSDCSVVLEFDRNYEEYRTGPRWWRIFRDFNHRFFGADVADRLFHCPNINSGVLCIRREAPHWDVWQKTLATALNRKHDVDKWAALVEQNSLNVAIYDNKLQMACLPATHNWSCVQATPAWNEQTCQIVECHPPHTPISILHLTGRSKGKVFNLPIAGGCGRYIETALDYESVSKVFLNRKKKLNQ